MQHITRIAGIVLLGFSFVTGCDKPAPPADNSPSGTPVKLALNWKPEPEFGGFYAAQLSNAYTARGLNVALSPAGDKVAELLAGGQTDFGILAADEVLAARAKNIDLVALFAVYQTNPQGIMTHAARGFNSLADVFSHDGTLAVETGLAYVKFLTHKYPDAKVRLTSYDYSIVQFMADKNHSQQCFVTSEPITASHKGGDPKVFLIAESGFNPYATVVVTRGQFLREHPKLVKDFIAATTEGWRAYLDDPKPANEAMEKLNPEMSPADFTAASLAQKPLIEDTTTQKLGLGSMTPERWNTLSTQLHDLGILDKLVPANEAFANPSP